MFQNFLKQKQNFSIESKNFGTKPKRFDVFQNFLKQFFLQVLLQPLLALSWPLLASTTLSRPQLTFSGTFSSLLNISRPLSTLSRPLKTLSQPLKHSQGLCSLHALSWLVRDNSQELSHGCESVAEAVRALYTLAASLGYPTRALSRPLLAPFWPLLTLSWPLLHSHGPTLILMGPCKHSHSSATVSRPPVALSLSLQALL